jgi:phenylacetate-CoA ligase
MSKMYWDEKFETMPLEEIQMYQIEKIKHLVKYAKEKTQYYKNLLKNVEPSKLRSADDVATLPITEPDIIIQDAFQLKSDEKICNVFCSGGTVSSPKFAFFTSTDMDMIYELAARKFYMMGIRSSDRVALMQPFDIYIIGIGHMEAYRKIGAEVIPLGVRLEQDFVIKVMEKLQPTVIDSSPSIVLRLTNAVLEKKLDPMKDFSIRKIILAGEKVAQSLREYLERTWSAEVFSDYGLGEMGIVAAECQEHKGLHIAVDRYFVEVIHPITKEPVKQGEIGELILTPLNLRGMPLIRYRTGDLVKIKNFKCPCGRTHPLIDIIGRKDETLCIDGIKLFPYQFDQALQKFAPEVINYQIVYENVGGMDRLRFICEADPSVDRDKLKQKIFTALRHVSIDFLEILEKSSIKKEVKIVEPFTISLTARGKTKKFIDNKRGGSK